MGVIITELAVSGDFCDGVPTVTKSASDAAAVLTEINGSTQVENAKIRATRRRHYVPIS